MIKSILLKSSLFIALLTFANLAKAQSELGLVWERSYDFAKGGAPTGFTPQPLYYAETGEARYLLTGTEEPRKGYIAMLDESGNVLKYWSIPIPAYYNKYPVQTAAARRVQNGNVGPIVADDPFTYEKFKPYYRSDNPSDILACAINNAVMKADGSIVAFGQVLRYRADIWHLGAVTDFSPGSHNSFRLLCGLWIIKIDKDGNITYNETGRGAEVYPTIFIYTDKILLTGLDINTTGQIGAAGKGVGMLHEYDLNGNFVAERCPSTRDEFPIVGASKYPNGDILLFGWSGQPAAKINPNNPNTIIQSFDAKTINNAALNQPMNGMPAIDGGGFFNPIFGRTTNNAPVGATFAKLKADGTLGIKYYEHTTSRNIAYDNPYILDVSQKKYVGTLNEGGVNYIYELTDNGTINDIRKGDPYPSNTVLRGVSLKDGFFSMGQNAAGQTIVAKLSTCANFKHSVGPTEVNMLTEQTFPSRTITHSGQKGTVAYSWTLSDITTGGNAIDGWGGIVKTGTTNVIPAQQFKLATNKDFALLRYTITSTDSYINNGVPQVCEQSYTILVKVYRNLPDNIITDTNGCIVPFEKIDFKIKHKWTSKDGTNTTNLAHDMSSALVGDLDGDGIPEVITYNGDYTYMYILDGSTGISKAKIQIPTPTYPSGGWAPIINAALVDSDGNGMAEIIHARGDKTIRSYEVDTTGGTFTLIDKWNGVYPTFVNPTTADVYPHINVVDFNGDGRAELLVYNQIYDAVTGKLLGRTEGNTTSIGSAYVGRNVGAGSNKATNFQTTIDMDGDGLPEIVAGGKVYKVTISEDLTTATCSKKYENTTVIDGHTAVADVDLDGNLEVVVINRQSTSIYLSIWRPREGNVTVNRLIQNDALVVSGACSFPFIGDIDGEEDKLNGYKKYPEICINVINQVRAYKYDPSQKKFVVKWTLATTDSSGGTTLTLFDFDNNGVNELVYRDESEIRIINGSKNTVHTTNDILARFACGSGTAYEYPTIADVDGDGSANICVSCQTSGRLGVMRAYESGNTAWAPTRKVWNQVNYEPTLINEDLTITKNPFPKHTPFEVEGKNHYPYNGALIQVPIMDLDMKPVVKAADPYIVSISTEQLNTTTARISITVGNLGKVNANSSLPVSLYAGSIATANYITTKPLGVTLLPGNTTVVSFDIPLASVKSTMSARLQDDGTNYPVVGPYTDCTKENNRLTTSTLMAINDFASPEKNKPIVIDVLANDMLGDCNTTTILLSVATNGTNGTAEPDGKKIKYTPNSNFIGTDSFTYKIKCGTVESTATVTIVVNSTLKVVRIDDAKEPNSAGTFRIMYTDSSFSLPSNKLTVYFTITSNADSGDYTTSHTSSAAILAGQKFVDVTVTPNDNFKVEGNGREVSLTITSATIE